MRVASRAVLAIATAGATATFAFTGAASAAAHSPAAGYSAPGSLNGVGAASTRNAWAVGYAGSATSEKVLMLHWNGSRWTRLTSPKILTGTGQLSAISVVSAKDAWAVGTTGSLEHPHSLILHWNGKTWSAVTSPKPVTGVSLAAVTANAKGGWIVGGISGQSAIQTQPLIFKLTGTKVTRSDPKFGAGSGVALDGVATTPTTTFATGLFTGMITGELARWNGTSWSFVKSFPQQGTFHWLNAIAAGPHGIAFAVGFRTSAGGGVVSIEWNGHVWIKAPAPNSANLNTVAFAPGGTGAAWSAGYRDTGGKLHPLILRWTGHAWSTIATPSAGGPLFGLAFATANYGWAVGNANPDSPQPKTRILHWNGHTWR